MSHFSMNELKILKPTQRIIQETYKPFSVPLHTLCFKLLHGDNEAHPGPTRRERLLVDPPLEDVAEAALSEEAVRAEVPRGVLEIAKCEGLEVARLRL